MRVEFFALLTLLIVGVFAGLWGGAVVTALKVEEWEQWAVADHYVKEHGADAPLEAADRADEFLERGEVEGAQVYIAIAKKAEQLLTPPKGPLN